MNANILNIIAGDLGYTLPGVLLGFGITYAIFLKNKRRPQNNKAWVIVFFVPWIICLVWAVLISGSAFGNLFGGAGLIFIPFGLNILTALVVSRTIEQYENSNPTESKLTFKQKIFKIIRIAVGLIAGFYFGIVWASSTYNMLHIDIENNLFNSGFQMFVARVGSLNLVGLLLVCSLYAFSYVFSKKWLILIIRIIEWIITIGIGLTATFGILNYSFKLIKGDGFYLSDILDDIGLIIFSTLVVRHLFKIPMTTRAFENFKFPWKNKPKNFYHEKDKSVSLSSSTGQIKACPECKTKNPIKAAYCLECGFNFKNEEVQHLLLKNRVPVIFVVVILGSIFAFQNFKIFKPFSNLFPQNDVVMVTTLAGSGKEDLADGTGTDASLNHPNGIAVDSLGNVYIADTGNSLIRKISTKGAVSYFAGGGAGDWKDVGTFNSFHDPSGIAVDSSGNVYVADTANNMIQELTHNGVEKALAGSMFQSGFNDGTGTAASFFWPHGVAADSSGNIYVADTSNNMIRKISPIGVVKTLAGGGAGFVKTKAMGTLSKSGSGNGIGTAASFDNPLGVAVDSSGNVYVADTFNNMIRKITLEGVVTTLAGSAGVTGATDGPGIDAKFSHPWGVAVNSSGNVYVADSGNNLIRKITPSGEVTTLAGSESKGFSDGKGTAALFNYPTGIAVDSSGTIYVADSGNNLIRKITQ